VIAVAGLVLGIALGLFLEPTVPVALQPYLPIAVVAALDASFGALRAYLDGIFDDKVFVVSFVSNVVIAALIVYLGRPARSRQPAVHGVVVVLGIRIFSNAGRDPEARLPCLNRRRALRPAPRPGRPRRASRGAGSSWSASSSGCSASRSRCQLPLTVQEGAYAGARRDRPRQPARLRWTPATDRADRQVPRVEATAPGAAERQHRPPRPPSNRPARRRSTLRCCPARSPPQGPGVVITIEAPAGQPVVVGAAQHHAGAAAPPPPAPRADGDRDQRPGPRWSRRPTFADDG
jgi:small basic protein